MADSAGGIVDAGFKKTLEVVSEGETKGVFGGEGKTLKSSEGDAMFSLKDKSYAGPGNLEFAPDNKGVKSNQP